MNAQQTAAKEHMTKLAAEVTSLAESIASKEAELNTLKLKKAGKEAEYSVWQTGVSETGPASTKKGRKKGPKTSLKTKGPKAKAAKPKAVKSTKSKVAPKASAAKKAGASTDASGVPPLRERIISVMGSESLSIKEVMDRLDQKGLMPDTKSPRAYISMMLSSNKDHFTSVSRGVYKVKTATSKKVVAATQTNGVANKKTKRAATTNAAASGNGQVEEAISDLGNNVVDNPFA